MNAYQNFIEEQKKYWKNQEKMKMDIINEKDKYKVIVELPGFEKNEIDIELDKDKILTIAAEKSQKKDESMMILSERDKSKRIRKVRLSSNIDFEKIKASYENGILVITLIKKENKPIKIM